MPSHTARDIIGGLATGVWLTLGVWAIAVDWIFLAHHIGRIWASLSLIPFPIFVTVTPIVAVLTNRYWEPVVLTLAAALARAISLTLRRHSELD